MNNTKKLVSAGTSVNTARKGSLRRLAKDTRGANFVEYIILVGLVALAGIGAYRGFGKSVQEKIGGEGKAVSGISW